MQHAWPLPVACSLLFAITAAPVPAIGTPSPDRLPEARPAPLYNPVSRCPRVRIADEGTIAVVVFVVGSTGVPSQASIGKSSQSKDLDDAALECVMKLRFSPAVRAGEGMAEDSWQKLGWRWAAPAHTEGAAAAPTSAAAAAPAAAAGTGHAATGAAAAGAAGAAPGGAALAGAAAAAPAATAGVSAAGASSTAAPVELRVCADEAGRLTQDPTVVHSSGNPGLDQAAVRIAKSGSGNYRPAATLNGKPTSGCAQMSIRFE